MAQSVDSLETIGETFVSAASSFLEYAKILLMLSALLRVLKMCDP